MKRSKADQAKLDKLGVEIALLSGELLRDALKGYPSEKPPSVKDMVASSIAWLDKVVEVPGKKEETKKPEQEQSQALTLEEVRKVMKEAKKELSR
jgi:hypothetical protein